MLDIRNRNQQKKLHPICFENDFIQLYRTYYDKSEKEFFNNIVHFMNVVINTAHDDETKFTKVGCFPPKQNNIANAESAKLSTTQFSQNRWKFNSSLKRITSGAEDDNE